MNTTDVPSNWPSSEVAARKLGISPRQLGRYVKRKAITRHKADDGSYRFDPEELTEFAEKLVSGEAGDDSEGDSLEPHERVLKEANDLVRQAQGHLERNYKTQHDITQSLLSMVQSENATLRERVKYLEEQSNAVAKLREDLLNDQHFRNIATLTAAKKDERKDKALGLVFSRLPGLLDKLETAAIGDSDQGKAVVKLLKGFDTDSLGMLLQTEIVNEEQKTAIRTILKMPHPVPEVRPDDSETPHVDTTAEST